jgi:hypothetical protein
MIKEMALEDVTVSAEEIDDILAGNYENHDDFLVESILDMNDEWNNN